MKSVCKITDDDLIKRIRLAKQRLLFMAPGVSSKVAEAISLQWTNLGTEMVNVILDVDPEVCRIGYGDIEGLQLLEERARKVGTLVSHQPGIRIGLLVTDSATVVFAPTPLLIEAGTTQSEQPNAIIMDSLPQNIAREVGLGEDGVQDQSIGLQKAPTEKIQQVAKDLRINPPMKFDIARKVRVFNAFFEFVEFELHGCFLSRKTVPMPSDILGLAKDKTMKDKLRSSFKLIDENSKLSDTEITEYKNRIAKDFLITLKGYGAVVLRSNKLAFEAAVEELRKRVGQFQADVEKGLDAEIKTNKDTLLNALLPSVRANPPERWTKYLGKDPDPDQLKMMLDDNLSAAFGTAKQIVTDMKVSVLFKGVTYELLTTEEFIKVAREAIPSLESLYKEDIAAVKA